MPLFQLKNLKHNNPNNSQNSPNKKEPNNQRMEKVKSLINLKLSAQKVPEITSLTKWPSEEKSSIQSLKSSRNTVVYKLTLQFSSLKMF